VPDQRASGLRSCYKAGRYGVPETVGPRAARGLAKEAVVTISSLSQFEAVLSGVTALADKIIYATAVSTKFEETQRVLKETARSLKNKEPLTKLQVQKFNKACEVFINEFGSNEDLLNKLYDLQDYLEFNPPK
jgi:hypothetical protein